MKLKFANGLAAMGLAGLFALSAVAGNEANPDAIELAPLPLPVEFKSDMDKPVAFDASTTVVVRSVSPQSRQTMISSCAPLVVQAAGVIVL